MFRLLTTANIVGFFAAAVALWGRYRTLPTFLTSPNICRLEAGGCQVLFRSPNAALLAVPNSSLGVFYYPFLGAGLLLHWPFEILLPAATFAFLMTLWLAWILIRDKLECRVCWTGHVCNAIIWLTFLFQMVFR